MIGMTTDSHHENSKNTPPNSLNSRKRRKPMFKLMLSLGVFLLGVGMAGALILVFALALAYPNLPDLESITSYKPKIPLRVFSADNVLLGEFGEERRSVIRLDDIPEIMKKALLSIEDNRFYEHGGVDYLGITRAALHNLMGGSRQGASTITQQVARNFFLSSEQTFKRKIYEVLMAWKIEQNLTKNQILEIYMNQIYLGQRAYGFASASQIYFGKKLQDITLAEAAMLAGLPKAPGASNPISNLKRAQIRQQAILQRMLHQGYITPEQYEQAKNEEIRVGNKTNVYGTHAEYATEMARQLVYEEFKEDTYNLGLNVYTTITKMDQDAAYLSLRRGVMDYVKKHGYRGPEGFLRIADDKSVAEDEIEDALAEHPDSDGILAAVVLEANAKNVRAVISNGDEVNINGNGLAFVTSGLSVAAAPGKRIARGSIIRVTLTDKTWAITQLPEVESAFVAINSNDGAIRALVGGFDFDRNKFNHVTQAWRQPGSSFKPFIYSASLEKGLSPTTIINDAPISFGAGQTGGQAWEPKNYDNKYEGPMTMRRGLAKSKNMISIRILNKIGAKYGQQYITRFGFDAEKNLPYLTLALGAGNVTPLQMAGAYSIFANGGYKINPYLISKITDSNGKILSQTKPALAGDENNRVIDERNAFLMDSMLKDVVKYGTAGRAMALNRTDLAGKTGTTNDSIDAWFAGYQPKLVGIAWMGFDQPRNLGNRETGGGLALPIWMGYMQTALKNVPLKERAVPAGIVQANGDYFYVEHLPPSGIDTLDPAEVEQSAD
ncbi:MAG: penicillin-binding protein [Solimicrobium sp.]|jgi:penicillin-binding protein 1A|nr:penicillin-binding protein [Solimicrobium sp.]